MPSVEVGVRTLAADDQAAVLDVLGASLGWDDREAFGEYFAWKHLRNPFGLSPGWVAEVDGEVVGVRLFMRWDFRRDGSVVRAVRAVDTATHPEHQGQGIFRRLTMEGLDGLRADGIEFVFNTPNAQSGPGYLKMGWREVGTIPLRVRFRPSRLHRSVRARAAGERWGLPVEVGVPAADALTGDAAATAIADLLASPPALPQGVLAVDKSIAYLRWRYAGVPALGYRILTVAHDIAEGFVVFRLRRRGAATELDLVDAVVPPAATGTARRAVSRLLPRSGADHLVALGGAARLVAGAVPVRRLGPQLVWRAVQPGAPCPPLEQFHLALGDIELF